MTSLGIKLRTFSADPAQALRAKFHNAIPDMRRSLGRRVLERNGVMDDLRAFQAARPAYAYAPDFGDLWFLYRQVRKRQPKLVLELGAGCSTVVFARAIHDNGIGRLISIDANKEWADATMDAIPVYLRSHVDMRHVPATDSTYKRLANFPIITPDLVYLDGAGGLNLPKAESLFLPGCLIICDDRKEMTKFLRDNLKRHYKFRPRRLFSQPTFELV